MRSVRVDIFAGPPGGPVSAAVAVAVAVATVPPIASARLGSGAPRLARVAAWLAPLGNLLESLPIVKLLLACGEDELVFAIQALQRTVLKIHYYPRSRD